MMHSVFARTDVRRTLKNVLLIVAGTLILAFGSAIFLLPFELVAGGVSGISLILSHLLPWDFITLDALVTVLTWSLFLVGWLVLGKSFAIKTLLSTIVYPFAVSLFLKLTDPAVLGGFFCLKASPYGEISLILASVLGGVFVGTGCAVTFLGGGSTGGVDVIAFTVCRIWKKLKSPRVLFTVDAAIIIAGVFVLQDLVLCLLGILSAFVASVMVDRVFLGGNRAFVAMIVSDRADEINAAVIESLERTTTLLDGKGGYTGAPKRVVMVSFTMTQYAELMRIVTRIDKLAFVTVYRAHEINGEGWTR
jgi:uncharacterized membrane-anchored protein YitT (DUF2179 family)